MADDIMVTFYKRKKSYGKIGRQKDQGGVRIALLY
jgi:hypothetical protein